MSFVVNKNVKKWFSKDELVILDSPIGHLAFGNRRPIFSSRGTSGREEFDYVTLIPQPS